MPTAAVTLRYVGGSEERVRDLFKPAKEEHRKYGPMAGLHVVALDELDAVAKRRGNTEDGGMQVRGGLGPSGSAGAGAARPSATSREGAAVGAAPGRRAPGDTGGAGPGALCAEVVDGVAGVLSSSAISHADGTPTSAWAQWENRGGGGVPQRLRECAGG